MVEKNAEYVKNELMEVLSAAMDAGLVMYVGFQVLDGELFAETYADDGDVEARWRIDIAVQATDRGNGGAE